MNLPYFYTNNYDATSTDITLDEDTSRHVVQVLRMKTGEQLNLTDGKGNLLTCEIAEEHKKHCLVHVQKILEVPASSHSVTIAISLLKNANRFEWFLEKATELGVNEIIPLLCTRTEKEKFRYERMQQICISAMLQSQQAWLPVLREPTPFENIENWNGENKQRFIAHCAENNKQPLSHFHTSTLSHSLICIGPEGDFTKEEIDLSLENGFIPVSLGHTRLRTETAGVVAATLLCLA